MDKSAKEPELNQSDALTTAIVRYALVAFVVFVCIWASLPFWPVLLWALVLAVALFPVQMWLERRVGGSPGRAATLLVLGGILIVVIPCIILASAFSGRIFETTAALKNGSLAVPEPWPGVADWPLIGADLHADWTLAATDLPALVERLEPQLAGIASSVLGAAAGATSSVFLLLGGLIIAGVMMAYAKPASQAVRKIFSRLFGTDRGPRLKTLVEATMRSVATGIIGIAFVTSIAFGLVLVLAGVPAAAPLTLFALLFGIVQLPITLVALVAVAVLWGLGDGSTLHNIIFSVLIILSSLIDNILKPLVLGRGVDAPMPVVLIGALGGMMSGGILGMFIGATFLAAGYMVFMEWVNEAGEGSSAQNETTPADAETGTPTDGSIEGGQA
ncbi:AI-2E family transporter [Roseibium sp.]|uniref:AI-2E family transporter n=1 Tax=Roseibium sp. TaxID=1936156 RepID=UPI003BAD1774